MDIQKTIALTSRLVIYFSYGSDLHISTRYRLLSDV